MLHYSSTDQIIRAFYTVYNRLGYGFLEKVYENALTIELQNAGLKVIQQRGIDVYYNSIKVGLYFADLCINDSVIVELKAATAICPEHEHQLLNYLKATNIEVGLLLNFGTKPEFKRQIFQNKFKNPSSSA
jgi:GxxExxY protein